MAHGTGDSTPVTGVSARHAVGAQKLAGKSPEGLVQQGFAPIDISYELLREFGIGWKSGLIAGRGDLLGPTGDAVGEPGRKFVRREHHCSSNEAPQTHTLRGLTLCLACRHQPRPNAVWRLGDTFRGPTHARPRELILRGASLIRYG